ncbi:MAG: hypothetical protein FWC41_12805, partial [Firmicutes bacterium]|nr:hypothetical protein [Bacillota bacterium]
VEYTKTKRGTDKSKNKILHTGNANKYVSNLLKNSSASDDMKHWKIENWKDNHSSSKNGTWFVDIETNPNYANLGEKSFKVSQSSPTHSLVSQQIEVPVLTQDKKYTFSADVKVDGELKGNGGALLQFYSWGGSIGFKNLTFGENLKSTDNEWRRISLTVTAPKGSSSLIFYFGLKDVTGIAWFDRVQVEEGEVPNDYNMIENSNFSCGMENWSGTNLEGKDGIFNRAMKLYGTSWNKKNVFQKISVNKTNPTFSVAASATANSVPFSSNKRFCIALLISYKDGGERWVDVEFNPAVTGSKQYASKNIPSVDYSPNFNQSKVVSSITLYLCYDYNQNSVEFHDVQVSIDEGGNSFAYDSRGNVIGLQDSAKNGINTERDVKSNEINRIVSPKGYKTDNIYDNKKIHRLIKSVSDILFGRTKTEFKHDEFGNVLKTTVSSDSNNGKIIESSATYSNQGNYSESITDSRGKTFYTFYDDQNGNLKQTMSAKNVKTDYEYDSVGRILSSKIGDTGNNYDYDNGLLSKITHKIDDLKKVTYSFIRNFFGQVTKVKVGNSTLVENIYDQGNGLPRRILYGNGHDIKYEYDKFGRIIKKSCSNGDYSYVYNNKSELYSAFDASNNIKTVFEYDLAGRVIVRRRSDGTTLTCSYDKHNLIENQKFQIEGVKQKLYNKFGPSDCLEYSEFDTNGIKCKHEYGYDNLGRNTEQTVNSENNNICQNIFKHCYNYLDLRESKTTFLVKDITYAQYINGSWKNINDKRYSYEYDEVGNITKITDHNGKETSYCYDDLNQLVRENNPYLGKTITYKYDLGGNILCKKFYEYKVEKPTVLLSTVNYSYDDENWKDKLTEYNDEKITYDEIGNPLKYRDSWNFTWQNGRQLTSGTKNNENITYKYNDLGIRVEKVVGG